MNKVILVYIFFVTVVFVSLVLFAASDFRGSDQYWYIADVETLLQGGPKTTNEAYPARIMSPGAQIPLPFMHNILNLYLVLPAATVFGSFRGWIVTNIVATILTASLIALIIRKVANGWISVLAYTAYLLLPLTMWQTSQPLAEATIVPFVAMGILIYVSAHTNKKLWGLLVIVVGLAYYCRTSFLPILFVIPITYLVQNKPVRIKNALYTLGLLSLVIFVIVIREIIFAGGVAVPFHNIISAGVPGVTDQMSSFYSLSQRPIVIRHLWLKVVNNLTIQLLPQRWDAQIFYLPFNVLTAFSLYFFFTKKSNIGLRITHCGVVLLLLHVATIIIHQNQFRYLLVATPIILVCSALVINKIKFFQSRTGQLGLILGLLVCLIGSNIPVVTGLRQRGFREKDLRTKLKSTFDSVIPKNESLMVEASRKYQLLAYTLRPRMVIFTRWGYKSEEYQTMREKGNVKWFLCPLKSPLVEHFNISSPPVLKGLPHPYKDYALFPL